MTARRYVLTPQAAEDLDAIWEYIAQDNVDQADRVIGEVEASCRRLTEYPEIGHTRGDLTELPVKFWTVFSYLIVYDPAVRPLTVIAVLHAARDVGELLKER